MKIASSGPDQPIQIVKNTFRNFVTLSVVKSPPHAEAFFHCEGFFVACRA